MRFEFGRNWRQFLGTLSNARIQSAMDSLLHVLDVENLEGRRFLDAGCGSGLFSLAALRLGAKQVVSFDYDSECVECARLLNREFGPYANWTITQGSVLNQNWLERLGKFDVVYSWGVLHHTGDMWNAIDTVCDSVAQSGILCISIYNNQGVISRIWTLVKRVYNWSPRWLQSLLVFSYLVAAFPWFIIKGIAGLKSPRKWFPVVNERGMHYYYDVVDWMGGYPFETATLEAVVKRVEGRGFTVLKVNRRGGSGCNEFVFRKLGPSV